VKHALEKRPVFFWTASSKHWVRSMLHQEAALLAAAFLQGAINEADRRKKKIKVKSCCGKQRCRCGTFRVDPWESSWWKLAHRECVWGPGTQAGRICRRRNRRFRVPFAMFKRKRIGRCVTPPNGEEFLYDRRVRIQTELITMGLRKFLSIVLQVPILFKSTCLVVG